MYSYKHNIQGKVKDYVNGEENESKDCKVAMARCMQIKQFRNLGLS